MATDNEIYHKQALQVPLAEDGSSLVRWRRLRPSWGQMLALGTTKERFLHVRIGDLEAWGNGFMLLVGNAPDAPLADVSQCADWSDTRRLLEPGACPTEPILYLEADGYGPQEKSLLIMAMLSPIDGALMEHLTVNARMALFIERECKARFPEGWILGWRGNLSAEARPRIASCAKVHPRPLTYCARSSDGEWIVTGVLMPRTAGSVAARDGSLAMRYHHEQRIYCLETREEKP